MYPSGTRRLLSDRKTDNEVARSPHLGVRQGCCGRSTDQDVSSVLFGAGFASLDCCLLDGNLGGASGRVAIALA
jgi:hypothetical protein